MPDINVRIRGLEELQRKLDHSFLLEAPITEALQTITSRIVDRPGKGLGARNNTLSAEMHELSAKITTTAIEPRVTGGAWQRKNFGIVRAMSGRVFRKASERIEAKWASGV